MSIEISSSLDDVTPTRNYVWQTSGDKVESMLMRVASVAILALLLAGCQHEDAGAKAAKMEQQDDATCQQQAAGKGADAYQQCRKNLMLYRQQVAADEEQQRASVQGAAAGLQQAGAALQSIR